MKIKIRSFDSSDDCLDAYLDYVTRGVDKVTQEGNCLYYVDGSDKSADSWFWTYEDTLKAPKKHMLCDPKTQIIKTKSQFIQLFNHLLQLEGEVCAWDTETKGLDPFNDPLVGIGVAWGMNEGESAYISLDHIDGTELDWDYVSSRLKHILESDDYPKTFHNAKFDIKVFSCNGINVQGLVFDTIIAHWLLYCEEGTLHAVEHCIDKYVWKCCDVLSYDELIKEIKGKKLPKNLSSLTASRVGYYCGLDCVECLILFNQLSKELEAQPKVKSLFYDVEMPIIQRLVEMELQGITVDKEWYLNKGKELFFEIEELKKQGIEYKEGLNIASNQQLNDFLFGDLNIDPTGLEKNNNGYSLNKDALKTLKGKHPIIELCIDHRKRVKQLSTFIRGHLSIINKKTGTLHCSFNQIGTVTGRLSCTDPNLQQVPTPLRAGLIAQPNHKLGSIDFSGCEYRILTHESQCKYMIKEYLNGGDAHTAVAKLFFPDKNPKEEWKDGKNYRYFGKQLNFSIVYGQSEEQTSLATGLSLKDIYNKYAQYWEYLPEIKQMKEDTKKMIVSQGFTETILGRRRYYTLEDDFYIKQRGIHWKHIELKKKSSPNDEEKFRQGFNARIQGSNADITKLSMINTHRFFIDNQLKMRFVLQVHDELVFDIPNDEIDVWVDNVPRIMSESYKLCIPLEVDYRIGNNWSEVKG